MVFTFCKKIEEANTIEEEEKPWIIVCNVYIWIIYLFFKINLIFWFLVGVFVFLFLFFVPCVCVFVELKVDKDI
jgi:hypothetical protein